MSSFISTNGTTSTSSDSQGTGTNVTETQQTHPTITYQLLIIPQKTYSDTTASKTTTTTTSDGVKVSITSGKQEQENKDTAYLVSPVDGVELTRGRDMVPATLKFKVPKDKTLNFQEGDRVQFSVNGTVVFYGFVFEKSRDREAVISVTAYDQLRYLKNKDCYVYNSKSASELIKMICDDYNLSVADGDGLAHTQVKVSHIEDNKTLADIISYALAFTTIYGPGHPIFELYDDGGKIKLQNVMGPEMTLDCLIDADVTSNYTYTTSIDKDTCNMVKIVRDVPEANRKTWVRTGEVRDDETMRQWGRLQYVIRPDDKNATPIEQAKHYLSLHDAKTREIKLKGVVGDVRVRGGTRLFCQFNFGDIEVNNYLMVSAVTHHFTENCHLMDIDLIYAERAGNYAVTYDNDAAVLKKIKAAEAARQAASRRNGQYSGSGTYSATENGAYSKLKSLGATDAQAAAVMGNIRAEDMSYDPYASNGDHFGLFQLDSSDRWARYVDWCNKTGNDPYCNDNQIEYVTTVENGNLFTGDGCQWGAMPDDAGQGAKWFNDHVEVSETSAAMGGDSSDRITNANDVMDGISSGSLTQESLSYPGTYSNGGGGGSLVDASAAALDGAPFGVDGCVRASMAVLAGADPRFVTLYQQDMNNGDNLLAWAEDPANGCTVEPYNGYNAAKGDLLLYGDNVHTVVADGVGGCWGNSSDRGDTLRHYGNVNYAWTNGDPPATVIHTNLG